MNTRKYPRTLNEAFGPYCGNQIEEDRPFDWQDKLVMVACLIVSICVIAIVLLGQP